jgi:hypothetical protein
MRVKTLSAALVFFALVGCAMVDVTKTAKETYNSTNPNDVEILLTRPEKSYVELGTVMVNCFSANYTAEIHNAIRAKAATLGANAVILTSQGNPPGNEMSVRGVAIRYKAEDTQTPK